MERRIALAQTNHDDRPWSRYDPLYDPLAAPTPGHGQDYAPTYWAASAGPEPDHDGPVAADIDVDVAIIGSGFTGLACALFLAREHGIKATVLEANRLAWGCTSRNGGQAQAASGRLSRSQWIARWGADVAQRMHREILDGFDTFKALIAEIDCDAQPGGHLYIAHKPSALEKLKAEAEVLRDVFNYPVSILTRAELHQTYLRDAEAVGAMHEPEGIGVHPLKLAYGYARAARSLGARIHPASPVTGWRTRRGRPLSADAGRGGQSPRRCRRHRRLYLAAIAPQAPRPLHADPVELDGDPAADCGRNRGLQFQTRQVITDTRTLRFYYRLLPGNRLQIGSRAAITGADAANPKHKQILIDAIARKFPPIGGIEIDYSWWGWVDVSHDMMPRIVQPEAGSAWYYAFGYGGNGVMYSAQAGRRLAQLVAGKPDAAFDLPIFSLGASRPSAGAISPAGSGDALPLVSSARRAALRLAHRSCRRGGPHRRDRRRRYRRL